MSGNGEMDVVRWRGGKYDKRTWQACQCHAQLCTIHATPAQPRKLSHSSSSTGRIAKMLTIYVHVYSSKRKKTHNFRYTARQTDRYIQIKPHIQQNHQTQMFTSKDLYNCSSQKVMHNFNVRQCRIYPYKQLQAYSHINSKKAENRYVIINYKNVLFFQATEWTK